VKVIIGDETVKIPPTVTLGKSVPSKPDFGFYVDHSLFVGWSWKSLKKAPYRNVNQQLLLVMSTSETHEILMGCHSIL
jgi:hypothetical protein